MVFERLTYFLEYRNILSLVQGGFRPGRSIVEIIEIVRGSPLSLSLTDSFIWFCMVVFCFVWFYMVRFFCMVDIMVKRLQRRVYDQHGLGAKPTRAILLCPWERHFTAQIPCLVVLASSSRLQSYLY